MKKYFNIFSCAMIFVVMLFANISFAVSDEDVNYVLSELGYFEASSGLTEPNKQRLSFTIDDNLVTRMAEHNIYFVLMYDSDTYQTTLGIQNGTEQTTDIEPIYAVNNADSENKIGFQSVASLTTNHQSEIGLSFGLVDKVGDVILPGENDYYAFTTSEPTSLAEYKLNIKSQSSDNVIEFEPPPDKDDQAELYEKVISFFIIWVGEKLNGLISVIAGEDISIDALVFDQYSSTTLTFFSNDSHYYAKENQLLIAARGSLNTVFDLFRTIALVCYMIILVYMGIRVMLLATADKKAKYKEILFDWVKGIAIIFFFPYVMRYTILLNHGFVTYLYDNTSGIFEGKSAVIQSTGGGIDNADNVTIGGATNYMNEMYKNACKTLLLSYSMCWFIMLIQVLQFLLVYMKRLITVMFLIAIFPLVAISYAIDKIGDGKSQAFDHWCKEFVLQVFVQSFHAVNYVIIMGIVFSIPSDGLFSTNWFLTIIGITYVAKGGDILRGFFAQMKGGTGKDGGPLSVAKALIKTKVAIGAVQSLGKTISSTVGRNSLLGKGVGRMVNAYDGKIQKNALQAELDTNQFLRSRGMLVALNPDGSRVRPELTDEQAKQYISDILNGKLTGEELVNATNDLIRMDPERINRLANELGLKDNKLKNLDKLLGHAVAFDIATNKRKGVSNYEIQQSVNVLIKERKEHDRKGGDTPLDEYIKATKERVSNGKLRNISASHSITVDEEKVSERKEREATMAPPRDKNEQLDRALYAATKGAVLGEFDIEELHEHKDVIKEAMAEGKYTDKIKHAFKEANYSFEDFEANLATQTINNSDRAIVSVNEDARRRLNESIKYVKDAKASGSRKGIINNVRANIDDLEEGVIPELRREQDEKSRLEKEIKEKMAGLDPYLIDKGEDYDNYLRARINELDNQIKEDFVKGAGTAIAGTGAAIFKTGLGVATAGTMAGMSMQGKDNEINELLTVVPSAFTMVNDVSGKAANMVVSASRVSKVDEVANAAVNKAFGITTDEDKVSLETTRQSIELNRKHYEEEARRNALNRELTAAEKERDRLLNRLNAKIKDETKRKK